MAGIDPYVKNKAFNDSPIPFTNVKGAFSDSLGELAVLGVLYHTKKVESFMHKKSLHKYEAEIVDMANEKSAGIIGYGDIGM